jgi:hypothetical protein
MGVFVDIFLTADAGPPVIEGSRISLDNVPIVTPSGDVLVRSVSFEITPYASPPSSYYTFAAMTMTDARQRDAPPHHGPKRMREEFAVPHAGGSVAHLGWHPHQAAQLRRIRDSPLRYFAELSCRSSR